MTNNFFFIKIFLKNILGKFFFFSKKYFGIIFLEKIIWKLNFANCNFGKTFCAKCCFGFGNSQIGKMTFLGVPIFDKKGQKRGQKRGHFGGPKTVILGSKSVTSS